MATHAPHVRTKKALRGRIGHLERRLRGVPKLRHSAPLHPCDTRLVRRGPPSSRAAFFGTGDPMFAFAACSVILAAAVLGVAMGIAQPSWLLAATLVSGGALVAAVIALAAPRLATSAYGDLR